MMKKKISKYKALFAAAPGPLQKQIVIRFGFSLIFLLLILLYISVLSDWISSIPFACFFVYSLVNAILFFNKAASGNYIVLTGYCADSETTVIRKRMKSIQLKTEEHTIRIAPVNPMKRISKGAVLEVYVAKNARIYEKDGAIVLSSYLAIDRPL